jgi:hypothetical protein
MTFLKDYRAGVAAVETAVELLGKVPEGLTVCEAVYASGKLGYALGRIDDVFGTTSLQTKDAGNLLNVLGHVKVALGASNT